MEGLPHPGAGVGAEQACIPNLALLVGTFNDKDTSWTCRVLLDRRTIDRNDTPSIWQ